MSFESLAGNEPAKARLRGLLARGRPAHAYVFSGPEGVGKRLAALEFARGLGATPLVVARPEDKHEILIAQVHEVIRELSFTSRSRRVVVFDDAHRMSEEAMNALLKTLEEPPAGTVLVLVTHVPDRLLGTLRSRCQTVLFFPLPDAEIERHARARLGLGEREAQAVALLAAGSIGKAEGLAAGVAEILGVARELQERVVSGELNAIIESLGKIKETEEARRVARRHLSILAHCLREALRARSGARPALASPGFVERLAARDEDEILDRIETLLDHERMLDLNANVALTVEDALLRI